MTADSPTADYPSPDVGAAASSGLRPRALANVTDRVAFCALFAALLLMYGLLQNRYWVPAGDSELYTVAARNLATGQGYTFNGQPVAIIPPGWSWMMSLVMRVTPYFWPLKLLAMSCMIASLLMGYWIVRRFVTPVQAFFIILLTAVISHVYQATYWLISESSFCLASSASLLVAMQIGEGKKQIWRIVLLLALCASAVAIRWAGVVGVALVVAALLDRQLRPRLTTPWIVSMIVVATTFLTFYGLREGLRGTPEQQIAAGDMVTGTGEDIGPPPVVDTAPPISGAANQSAKAYHLFPTGSYADRFLNWGRWFSYLFWQPFRAAAASTALLALATMLGWMLIALYVLLVIRTMRHCRWIWLALGVYTGFLALGWTNVNARYYVPVAFLLMAGVFVASDELTGMAARSRLGGKAVTIAFALFVGSVAVCNVALWSVEMAIARSDRFYSRYEDGLNTSLIATCQYLTDLSRPPGDREIAVSQRYQNMNRTKASPFGLRAAVLLTGREIVTPRFRDTSDAPTSNTARGRDLRRWLKGKGIKWYLHQPEISPWRVWHFRLGWYEKWQVGHTAEKDTAGWQLYRHVGGDRWTLVRLPGKFEPVTRVPGL